MNASSDLSTVNRYVTSLEKCEARRRGIKEAEARPLIAGRIGISPGTLENLRRMRTKVVPNWLMNRVRAELISVLQSEMTRLQHEIDIHKQIGAGHSDDLLEEAETSIASAREILKGECR